MQVSLIEPEMFKTGIATQVVDLLKQFWNDLSPEVREDYGDKYLDKRKSLKLCSCSYSSNKHVPGQIN